jgi:NAD-reducing hydrogenase large subunit
MLHSVERIEELMADADLFGEHIQAKASLNRREGIGSCEAPRGTLFHHYWVDPDGLMTRANLLIATGQNSHAMNESVDQTAKHFLKNGASGPDLDQGFLNRLESAIRCYDPCLSCSTHALGQMPLEVELLSPEGAILQRITRDS